MMGRQRRDQGKLFYDGHFGDLVEEQSGGVKASLTF